MSAKKKTPTIVYNIIPNILNMMDIPDTINKVKSNINEYGENLYRNYNMSLEYLKILNIYTPAHTTSPRRLYQRPPMTSLATLFNPTWSIEERGERDGNNPYIRMMWLDIVYT